MGPRPNTTFIASSLEPATLTDSGYVKVTSKLQLPTYPSIFAGGDIIDWPEQKQAGKTRGHASVVVPNVLSFLADQEPSKHYKGSPEMIVVTNGKVCFGPRVFLYSEAQSILLLSRKAVLDICPSCGDLSWARGLHDLSNHVRSS